MATKIDIVALARAIGIDEDLIKTLSKRELCNLVNQLSEKTPIDCNSEIDSDNGNIVDEVGFLSKMQWKINKVLKKTKTVATVEWAPTCATQKELELFRRNFPIESVEENQIHVEWKNSWITRNDPIRLQKQILQRDGNKRLVSWHSSCITKEVYEKEKENIEKILNSNAFLIRWPIGQVPSANLAPVAGAADEKENEDEKPTEKKRRTCQASEDVERIYDPALERLVVQPEFPSDDLLHLAGSEMLAQSRKKDAQNSFKKYWRDRVGSEFSKLYYIENPGGGDCMYYALAPMIRALKPNLFEPAINADKDMVRLRQLLATKIGNTANDVNTYLRVYESNFATEAQKKAFRKQYPPITDSDNLQERKVQLQNDLIQSNHWAHLNDFNLLHDVLGPSVRIIIFEADFSNNVPPFHLVENAAEVIPNSKFIFIVHSSDHFVRLQHKDGRFAFSPKEFNDEFPFISTLYQNLLSPPNINLELIRLKDDVLAQYPSLRNVIPSKGEFDTFYYKFLGIAKNQEADAVKKIIPQIERYSSLDESQKMSIRNTLLGNSVGASAADLATLAQQKVDQYANRLQGKVTNSIEPSQSSSIDDVEINEPLCDPLTADEEKQYKIVMAKAEGDLDGEILNVNGLDIRGRWIILLKPLNWLNSDIVNIFFELLVQEHNEKYKNDRIEAVSTFLYDKIAGMGGVESVKKWKNPLANGPLNKLFIPINADSHWFLCVVNFKKKQIQFYDSLCSLKQEKSKFARNIVKYLQSLDNENAFDFASWSIISAKEKVPQQFNGSDCGVFVMAYAEQLKAPSFDHFTFTQADISCFRKRILLRLIAANKKQ